MTTAANETNSTLTNTASTTSYTNCVSSERANAKLSLMPASGYEGFIFDLDGTLLHTLPDLVVLTNKALETENFPTHDSEAILRFVGNGVLSLVLQALPEWATKEQGERVYHQFRTMYPEYGTVLTREYEGIIEVLTTLNESGKKVAIMSNKFEAGVKELEERFFKGLLASSHGETEVIPRKPDPTGLLLCAEEMGLEPKQCVYFGDSASDMIAAHNAGMYAVGVTWGYQPLEKLKTGNPHELIDEPREILRFR